MEEGSASAAGEETSLGSCVEACGLRVTDLVVTLHELDQGKLAGAAATGDSAKQFGVVAKQGHCKARESATRGWTVQRSWVM
ncbi:hypothetical protein L7F22_041174, partial [Adiantum nelumboides]|nr:hypothetical protein [Adiantum nelumboides]